MGRARSERLPDLLNEQFDVARVLQDPLQPFRDDRLMSDIAFEDAGGVVEDFIDGASDFTKDALGAGTGRGHFLHGQKLEGVERHGDLARKELEKLQVVFVKGAWLRTFDVERSQDFVVKDERNGQRAARPGAPGKYSGSVVVSSHR